MGERMGIFLDMPDRRLAVPNPANYRFAVFCCSFKMDLGSTPDYALALFVDQTMAERYGAWMWPTTFEVVDLEDSIGARK
ncbi:hypothetical protein D3C75_1244660 [compost metagenome]